ncbi:hypothetical protein LzC2_26280 [Planctomycetes bacterium LzC2]|uniref:Uncharacterized protein n=1 Tax=Alienimonas chondri TaxID=2681879 RepID=A0ABX1VFM5_9PLAN|nr:hypothetical protein [Alienimonas chondri]
MNSPAGLPVTGTIVPGSGATACPAAVVSRPGPANVTFPRATTAARSTPEGPPTPNGF